MAYASILRRDGVGPVGLKVPSGWPGGLDYVVNMEFLHDAIGFVGAWLDALGIPGMALVGVFALIFYWTRKRPGRRYDRRPRPVAESREGWWFTG